jgi:hypothetical protein
MANIVVSAQISEYCLYGFSVALFGQFKMNLKAGFA